MKYDHRYEAVGLLMERAITEDQKRHPECSYSQSSSKSCRVNAEGKYECETVASVLRHCMGSQPQEIYSSHTTSDGKDPEVQQPEMKKMEDSINDAINHAFGRMPPGLFSFPPLRHPRVTDRESRSEIPLPPHNFPKGEYPFSENRRTPFRVSPHVPAGADVADV